MVPHTEPLRKHKSTQTRTTTYPIFPQQLIKEKRGKQPSRPGSLITQRAFPAFQIPQNALYLLQGRLQIVRNLLGQYVRFRKVCRILQAFIPEPEKVQTDLIPADNLLI